MRRENKYTDFIGHEIQYDTDHENVVDGMFECNHCGKANIRYRDLNKHFEECFKKSEMEWQNKHHPSFNIIGWELAYVRFQKGMDVSVLPIYHKKEEGEQEMETKKNWKPITTNVGQDKLPKVVCDFCDKYNLTFEVIHIKPNRNGNYAVFYEAADE